MEEIGDHLVTILATDALGVELDALHERPIPPQTHHIAIQKRARADLQIGDLADRGLVGNQGMVSGHIEGIGQALEAAFPVVAYPAHLAMLATGGPDHTGSSVYRDGLHAQTDAEDRLPSCHLVKKL